MPISRRSRASSLYTRIIHAQLSPASVHNPWDKSLADTPSARHKKDLNNLHKYCDTVTECQGLVRIVVICSGLSWIVLDCPDTSRIGVQIPGQSGSRETNHPFRNTECRFQDGRERQVSMRQSSMRSYPHHLCITLGTSRWQTRQVPVTQSI